MFGFGRKNKETAAAAAAEPPTAPGLFQRLKQGLARTRASLSDGLADLVLGRKQIDDDLLEDLETLLLTADVGVAATELSANAEPFAPMITEASPAGPSAKPSFGVTTQRQVWPSRVRVAPIVLQVRPI